MYTEHRHHLEQLESVIDQLALDTWTQEVEAWEADNSKPNPFEPRVKREGFVLQASRFTHSACLLAPTQNEVRLALASHESQAVDPMTANQKSIHCEVTGSTMINMGLELEELQYVFSSRQNNLTDT